MIVISTSLYVACHDRHCSAVSYLESLDASPESDAMWSTLAKKAVADKSLFVAARFIHHHTPHHTPQPHPSHDHCRAYAAIGDVSKAQYLQRAIDAARVAEETYAQNGGNVSGSGILTRHRRRVL